eukprot:CAMPEP_0198131214 /NCGR_PEP_ID=MMETSP1442-20131203/55670_1 /TAXON_ID= /ORGANISM="Craspedostauros australis, Strain CCMP3328" /LENGTH=109 /DNA_ID=CAMNT_0043791979 /DNA_START=35 /DNA_END=364 /DNA_ORIENTATION=+
MFAECETALVHSMFSATVVRVVLSEDWNQNVPDSSRCLFMATAIHSNWVSMPGSCFSMRWDGSIGVPSSARSSAAFGNPHSLDTGRHPNSWHINWMLMAARIPPHGPGE